MPYLTSLILQSNQIALKFPSFVITCWNLTFLDLSWNTWTGSLPESMFTHLTNLEFLSLSGNFFEGPLPGNISKLSKVKELNLGSNKFSGSIPDEIGLLHNLQVLELLNNLVLAANSLTGPLPSSFSNLTQISELNLSDNILSGKLLPHFISNRTELTSLRIQNNTFIGIIPPEIGMLKELLELETWNLLFFFFCGTISQQLTGLTFLSTLNLSENHLSGAIPYGSQLDTFSNDSFLRNLALCGVPLTKKCIHDELPTREVDDVDVNWFNWKMILLGHGIGFVCGLSMGYIVFTTLKPLRFVIFIERAQQKLIRRTRK
ncbi:MDIS1-interacting receptor like kinase 1-like [Heracleum sosnowskyi]|uniref:MDIS1-interacting receptor like kinase 1-like n=1 Tax=Heracleum sosnowskyi TaxID=360622 RepID=A0AAD8MET0_9APIA|nr:MDIS1-interacting receptor like kinase 1-like [Heracleum sosnowskyi]